MAGTAVVLGAGGPVGLAFHAGALAALEAGGADARRADLVVGTSIGSVVGALLRAGLAASDLYALLTGATPSPAGSELLERFGGWPSFAPATARRDGTGGRRPRVRRPVWRQLLAHPSRLRPGTVRAALVPEGEVSTRPLAEAVDRVLAAWPPRPLVVGAVEAASGRRVVLGPTSAAAVGTAVAASCAVPGYFAPVAVGGRRLVDGGTHSPANSDLAARAGRWDEVVVSLPMGLGGRPGRGGADLPGRALNQIDGLLGLARARAGGAAIRVLAPDASCLEVMGYDAFAVGHLEEVARRAYRLVARRR